jgi:hypothetical protein
MLSATQEPESALHVIQRPINSAPSRKNVTKNANHKKYQSATAILESVKSALMVELAASQLRPVKKHAKLVQQNQCTNATGQLNTQVVLRTKWQQ